MIRNTRNVSVNEVQGYLIKGAHIHPRLYEAFLKRLIDMEYQQNLCLVPSTRLEFYSKRVATNIARCLAA